MKDRIFSVLQRVGRSFMLPIAILPVAGLLLGIGSSFTNATTIEKEIASFAGDISQCVPPFVADLVYEKYGHPKK